MFILLGAGWRIQIGVDESGEMVSKTEEIARGEHCVAPHFAFDDHVTLMDERILKTVSKVIDSRCSRQAQSPGCLERLEQPGYPPDCAFRSRGVAGFTRRRQPDRLKGRC